MFTWSCSRGWCYGLTCVIISATHLHQMKFLPLVLQNVSLFGNMCMCVCVCVCVFAHTHVHAMSLQLCLTLCNPVDGSPPHFSVRGFLQARILAWVAMPFSRRPSCSRDRTQVSYGSCIAGRFFRAEPPGKPKIGYKAIAQVIS